MASGISQRQLFLQHVAQTSPAPLMLEIERAEGMYLYSPQGKKYMDLIAGICVSALGHCHPKVVKAIQDQAASYMHLMVYGEYVYAPQVQLATKLASLLPPNLNNVYLVNSGAEATEGALKLCKKYSGRSKVFSFHHSYHGSTTGALSLLGDEYFRSAFRPLMPGNTLLHYGVEADLSLITEEVAAVFFEPVQAESGINVPSVAYVQALRKRCMETGTLLVFDEIQTGLGRTGKLFAFEHYNVVPDVLLLAKGLGGGMPIGAFIASQEIMQCLTHDPVLGHITTFGGNAVCAAAALANVNALIDEKYVDEVESKGALFEKLLSGMPCKAIRRKGLMMSVEFENAAWNQQIIQACIEHGVITDWFLFAPHCLRIAPPLIITEAQIAEACEVIQNAVKKVQS
jgi:acetylornithine/N-succinyldiaminopimelate aminotransferase